MKGMLDEEIIPRLGEHRQIWITKDDRARSEHEPIIVDAKISTVWIRGMGRLGKNGRKPGKNVIRMKDILFLLVNKLEQIEVATRQAKGPRHYILYLNEGTGRAEAPSFASLKEVRDALGNISKKPK